MDSALTDDDMRELFDTPAYKEYDRLLRGTYIAALMERTVRNMREAGIVGGEIVDGTASTLSDELKKAFQESQAELEWTPLEIEAIEQEREQPRASKKKSRKTGKAKKREASIDDDFGAPIEIEDEQLEAPTMSDFAPSVEEPTMSDFGAPVKPAEDDFGGDDDKVIID